VYKPNRQDLVGVEWDELLLFLMQDTNIWAEERSEKSAVFVMSPVFQSLFFFILQFVVLSPASFSYSNTH